MKYVKAGLGLLLGLSLLTMSACSGGGGPSGNPKPQAGGGGSKEALKEHVRIAQSSDGFLFAPIYLAKEKGYFAEEGLDVDVIIAGGGSKVLAAVIGGGTEIGATGIANVMEAAKNGQNLKMFASLMNQYASNVVIRKDVAAKKGITESSTLEQKIKALQGLKIAITAPGSSSDKLIRTLLKSQNINPDKDVQLVPLSTSDLILPAFTNKQIDAFSLSSPTSDIAALSDNGMMLINLSKGEVKELDGFLYTALVARQDFIDKNPATLEKMTRAIAKAEKLIKSDKNGTKEALRTSFKTLLEKNDPKVFDTAFENNYAAFATSPVITKEGYDMNVKFEGIDVPFDKVVLNKFADMAK